MWRYQKEKVRLPYSGKQTTGARVCAMDDFVGGHDSSTRVYTPSFVLPLSDSIDRAMGKKTAAFFN